MRVFICIFAAAIASSQPALKPGSVEGTVINSVTKFPVTNATVTLQSTKKHFGYAALSDQSGKFKFPSVEPATEYAITADAPGFIHEPAHRSRVFTVAEDQNVTGITAPILPGGSISGKVVDADGDPVIGAQVQLHWYGYQSGTRQLQDGVWASTDDRGEYRLPLLTSGRYYLQVRAPARQPDPPGRIHRSQPDLGFAETFYPAARDISGATPVDLSPGSEIGGIDLRLQKVRLFHIRGKIKGSIDGPQIMRTGVIVTRCESDVPVANAPVSMDGGFDIPHAAPGDYCLTVQADQTFAHQTVTVSDRDVDNVSLSLTVSFQLKGSVVVEGAALENQPSLRVTLEQADRMGSTGGQVHADGSFVADNVQPMPYTVGLGGLLPNAYVKAIRMNGRDASDGRIAVTSGADTLTFVLGSDPGRVTGSLTGAGIAVVVAPAGQSVQRDQLHADFTDANGNFTIIGLAPGDYQAFAFEEIDLDSMHSPEYRQVFEGMATSVTVHPNASESVELQVISADRAAEALKKLR